MLTRISLIIAIIAALAAGALNFIKVKEKITNLITERNSERSQKEQAQTDLAKTRSDLETTQKDLKQTQEKLATTEQERDLANSVAALQTKKAEELTEKLAKTTQELNTAQAELAAYVATGYKPEQISSLGKQIKDSQLALEVSIDEKKIIQRKLDKTLSELEKLRNKDYHVPLPADLSGKVLVADPKWDFVVIDVGETKEVLKDGELLVNRNGRLVAKLRISEVQKDRSIANVMPGWKLADVMEGDQVIPAYMPE